ncbi:uncharacterized protein LOC131874424 [Cryptomeria japonica]|uniref:uncharacterized protein LOC131874424 n=1 Tax=Cryptomeria japonica TaxID=3369 RepID=UPI0027DA4BA7|nr:uncharacterized protein LOC131874424 [Cryptomeria japonica]
MRLLSWNVRGCNAPENIILIKRCLDQFRLDTVCLQETKIKIEDFATFHRRFKKWKCALVKARGASGGLAIMWNDSLVDVTIMRQGNWWQWVRVFSKQFYMHVYMINVYGANNTILKRQLWTDLSECLKQDTENIFIIGGDFNGLVRPLDKMGGVGWNRQSNNDFNSFIRESGLIEIPFKSGEFAWTNKRSRFLSIDESLDRFFIVGDWSSSLWTCIVDILPFTRSNHYRIYLRIQDEKAPDRCPFKFEEMWIMDNNLVSLMEVWRNHIQEKTDHEAINREAISHFSKSFNGEVLIDEDLQTIMDIVPTCVKEQHNKMLLSVVPMEEARSTVFGMGSDKAPGSDGFLALFFQKFWDILARDIWEFVEESRKGGFVLQDFNNTFIALIPKKENISTFNDCRPISLCNTIYKVISKVIENRLKRVLEEIISPEHSGFALGRSIYKGIILAHEAIHSIRLSKGEKMMIKVDIKKAYDEVQIGLKDGGHFHFKVAEAAKGSIWAGGESQAQTPPQMPI